MLKLELYMILDHTRSVIVGPSLAFKFRLVGIHNVVRVVISGAAHEQNQRYNFTSGVKTLSISGFVWIDLPIQHIHIPSKFVAARKRGVCL